MDDWILRAPTKRNQLPMKKKIQPFGFLLTQQKLWPHRAAAIDEKFNKAKNIFYLYFPQRSKPTFSETLFGQLIGNPLFTLTLKMKTPSYTDLHKIQSREQAIFLLKCKHVCCTARSQSKIKNSVRDLTQKNLTIDQKVFRCPRWRRQWSVGRKVCKIIRSADPSNQ